MQNHWLPMSRTRTQVGSDDCTELLRHTCEPSESLTSRDDAWTECEPRTRASPGACGLLRLDFTMTLQLTTPAFKPGADIPAQCTCDGSDTSPALSWNTPPERTQSFALVVEDPDAPGRTWVHWVLYNLPPTERELPEGVPPEDQLPSAATSSHKLI